MTDLTAPIERLEKATGPDRELDREIADAVGWEDDSKWEPKYTASLDVALTLVPEVLMVSMTRDFGRAVVNVKTGSILNPETKEWSSCHAHWPIALCIAALRARVIIEPAPSEEAERR